MGRARDLIRYSATRLGLAPLMLWLIATLVFLLLRVAPGDPVDAVLGSRAPAAAKAAMRARLGLDQSLFDQYLSYLNGLIHGDLGQALINQEPVSKIIGNTLPASLELSVIALIAAAFIGLSIGFSGLARPEGSIDLSGRLYGLGTYALPPIRRRKIKSEIKTCTRVRRINIIEERKIRQIKGINFTNILTNVAIIPCDTEKSVILNCH